MEINHNGITYDIRVSTSECNRRVAHLLAALYGRPHVVALSQPTPADGAETQSDRSHEPAPANPSQPRYPVRVTVLNARTGTSFLPCGAGGGAGDAPTRKGTRLPIIEFSESEYSEASTKRPPGDQTRGP